MKQQEFIVAATEIRILLGMLTKMSRQEWQEHLDKCGVGISALHHGVMRLLYHHPYTIKELSKHMLVEPASLVPVVDELERKSYLRRTTDPQDRRRTPLVLTDEGQQMILSMPPLPPTSRFMQTLETMGEEKLVGLLSLLRELAQGMSENQEMIAELSKTVQMQMARSNTIVDKEMVAKLSKAEQMQMTRKHTLVEKKPKE